MVLGVSIDVGQQKVFSANKIEDGTYLHIMLVVQLFLGA